MNDYLKAEIWETQSILYYILSVLLIVNFDHWLLHFFAWLMIFHATLTLFMGFILKVKWNFEN